MPFLFLLSYKFFLTPLAVSDVDETLAYISGNLANPVAASALLKQIDETIDRIRLLPFANPDCSCFMIQDQNIRHVQIGNYVMIYEVDKEKSSINILRFRYSAMDLTSVELKNR